MMPTLLGYLFVGACPQGSVLGPLLFNIFLNDLLLLPTNSNINSYADDTQLFLHGLNPITTQTTLQSDLTLISG